jgi:MraZ protein
VITYNPFELGCLWLFPYAEWEPVRDQVNALSKVVTAHRDLQMKLVGAAAVVEPDGAARILLPASQRATTGIEKKAVLLGMGNKFELWSEQAHLAKIRETIGEEQITEDMLELKL